MRIGAVLALSFRVTSLIALAGCGGGPLKSLDLTVTLLDGTVVKKSLSSEGGFFYDGQQRATAAFPPIAEWTAKAPLGLSVKLDPLQPGRYGTSGNLHLGGDGVPASKSLTLDVSIERVRWQADPGYPFRLEGTLTGTSSENHKVEGRFSTTMEDCADPATGNSKTFLCGAAMGKSEQKWQLDGWVTQGDCPDALLRRYAGGPLFTIDGRFAVMGGQRDLRCVSSASKVICGANEEGFVADDGCTWALTVLATPGTAAGPAPTLRIFGGTTGTSCPAKLCAMSPKSLVHLSGAN